MTSPSNAIEATSSPPVAVGRAQSGLEPEPPESLDAADSSVDSSVASSVGSSDADSEADSEDEEDASAGSSDPPQPASTRPRAATERVVRRARRRGFTMFPLGGARTSLGR